MKRESFYNLFYFIAAALLSTWIFISIKQLHNWGGWLLMLFFLSIAFAFRCSKTLKGLSYTMMIMAAVSIAMYHPQYCKTIGDYKFSALIITAAGRDNLIKIGGLLIAGPRLHHLARYFFGYWSASILKFTEKDPRASALEAGMQTAGLASGLALSMGKLTPGIFGPVMNVTRSTLTSWWHNRIPKVDIEEEERNQQLNYKFHHH